MDGREVVLGRKLRPTHSSSTCFIRRDTLRLLGTRVLRGGTAKARTVSGVNPRGGRQRLRWGPGQWTLQGNAESFESSGSRLGRE